MLRSRLVSALVFAGMGGALIYLGWLLIGPGSATPLLRVKAVARGDQEIAWIHLATSTATWERFVEGAYHARQVLREADPPLELEINDQRAFPPQTAEVPELGWRVPGGGWLWVRYYKLTSETNAGYWVRALGDRKPAPLAIVGGMSSDQARDLARSLRDQKEWQGQPPVLLIASATADRVAVRYAADQVLPGADEETEALMRIYPERSFRFCFTNAQMADAVLHFIWSQPELKPDEGAPVYMVSFRDDPYSQDLAKQFYETLWPAPEPGSPVAKLTPPGPPWKRMIPYSIGGFSRPNPREAEIADQLLDELVFHPLQDRALLVLPAASQPARRFLRALVQTAPREVHHFTVATGDYIDFNTVCRDRNFAWPIQDLPIKLVFFCHRNPVEATAGFNAATEQTSTGTHDVLLYSDMVQGLVKTAFRQGRPISDSDALREGLRGLQHADGQPRFAPDGDLRGGGEYVVQLVPERNELDRVQPWAWLQVHRRVAGGGGWELVRKLQISYAGRTLGNAAGGTP